MTIPIRTRTDLLHRVDEVWSQWRTAHTAPPLYYLQSWHIRRQHGGMVHVGFDSEAGWGMWATYLGLDWVKGPNEYNAHGLIDGVRIVLTCPHQVTDQGSAA